MASDKHFLLMPGDYDIYKTPFAEPYKTVMKNLRNVTIEGVGDIQVSFLTENTDCDTLSMENCRNITLKNLYMGHVPQVNYECAGAVLYMYDCDGLTIQNCTLFGSGEYGIFGGEINGLFVQDTGFIDCSENLVDLYYSSDITFENCSFINEEDQSIEFWKCSNVLFRNCELSGELIQYPSIIVDDKSILNYPSDGNTYVVTNEKYSWVSLENVSITGSRLMKEISDTISSHYDGVSVSFDSGYHYFYGLYMNFCLTFQEPIPESAFLRQTEEVLTIIKDYYKDDALLSVVLSWDGGSSVKIYRTFEGTIEIFAAYDSLESVMQDGRKYLSVDEARDILSKWLPPVINSDDGKPLYEENIEVELICTMIDSTGVYYRFDILNGNIIMFPLSVDALSGSIISTLDEYYSDEVYHASPEQIEAVMAYLNERGIELAEDVNWRAYIFGDGYLYLISSDGDKEGPFILYEKDGRIYIESF